MIFPLRHKSARKLHFQLLFLAFFSIFLFIGCAPYKIPTESLVFPQENRADDTSISLQKQASSHPLYKIIPRHRCQVRWYDVGHWTTWMLFGNDDDGIFGEGIHANYKPAEPISGAKALKWTTRNPFHNFCFYVIGSAHTTSSEFALIKLEKNKSQMLSYKKKAEGNGNKGSFFFLGFHGYKPYIFLRLLYSQKYKGQWYLGWRERGNFGIMFSPFAKVTKDDV